MQKQQTLAAPFTLEGKGLHTGLNITATFCPSEPNTGYRFQRIDLEGEPIVEAVADNVAATNRGTVVKKGDITISTIEHAMAALYCLGVDNCLIKLNAPEIPILDGSALPWVKAIQNVGVVEQSAKREIFRIMKKYEVVDEASGVKLEIFPDDHFSVTTFVDYPSPVLNNQFAVLNDINDFADQVAAARTFVFVREIQPLLAANLIKGGDLDNAVVIYDKKVSQEELNTPTRLLQQLAAKHHQPRILAMYRNVLFSGTTNLLATNFSTSSATLLSSASTFRVASLPLVQVMV